MSDDGAPARARDRLLVVAPNWLGDAVMALPAIDDVRRQFPDARLIVAARRAVASLFELVASVDEVTTLEWRGQPLRRRALAGDVARLQSLRVDAALLLPNSFATAWLLRRAGIPERWGYATDCRRPLLSRAVRPARRSMHQGSYYQHLVRELGIENGPLEPAVRITGAMAGEARALLGAQGWDGHRPLVVMAPGAAYGTAKRWPPESFAGVAAALIETQGAHCVLVGSAADAETTGLVRAGVPAHLRGQVTDLAGRTSLAMLTAVLSLARVTVSNDSGAMHLAAAAGVPVAALFGPTREYETAPLARQGIPAEYS